MPLSKAKLSHLPSSPDIEKATLGLMIEHEECLQKGMAGLTVEDFYEENIENNTIFRAINLLFDQKTPVSIETILNKLKDMKESEAVNFAYLDECILAGSSIVLMDSYIEILNNQKTYRKMLLVSNDILLENQKKDINDLSNYLVNIQNRYDAIFKEKRTGAFQNATEISKVAQIGIEDAVKNGNRQGITTRFSSFDRLTRGFQPSDLIILAARPGVGKTALAINIATNVCLDGKGVGFFSAEMDTKQIAYRFLSYISKIPSEKLEEGNLKSPAYQRDYPAALRTLEGFNLFIDDSTNVSLTSLTTKATILKNTHPNVKLLIIDYLGLIHYDGNEKNLTNAERVSRNVVRIKELARELNIAILLLCQLSRKAETRQSEPQLQDLRETGSIEQEANKVIFIFDEVGESQRANETKDLKIIVAKNRSGKTGFVPFKFSGATMTFTEAGIDNGMSKMIPKEN